jgi:dynein heavy chain
MLPTPAKFHYSFNMRDLSRIFQGMLLAPRETIISVPYVVSLWRHECERVLCDKLTNREDRQWLISNLNRLTETEFGREVARQTSEENCVFVNFLRDPIFDDEGICINEKPIAYERTVDRNFLRARTEKFMEQMNTEVKVGKLDLVLFDDALSHLVRVCRILGMARGSILLVGVGGSGKQSLSRLASYINSFQTFQIAITKSYNVNQLFEDLKSLYKTAGFLGRGVTFILTDAEIKEEGFLEYINQVLSTGQVANLFPKDELDLIVNDIRPTFKKESKDSALPDTWDNLHKFFMDRARDNLHLVLCFSPVGDKFASRARQFPALTSCTTIDWMLPWPEEALRSVATRFVGEIQIKITDTMREALVDHMACAHKVVSDSSQKYFDRYRRNVYITPKSFLCYISTFKELYRERLAGVTQLSDKIRTGLAKLAEAAQQVKLMQVELTHKEVELAEAQRVASVLLLEIQVCYSFLHLSPPSLLFHRKTDSPKMV